MDSFADAVTDAGGVNAPLGRSARLRALLAAELERGDRELRETRSGYGQPLVVAFAVGGGGLLAACPAPLTLRADPEETTERGWLVVAAAVGALVDAIDPGAPRSLADLALRGGDLGGKLVLALARARGGRVDPEYAALSFDEQTAAIDRLRVGGVAAPGHVLEKVADVREPVGAGHPLHVAEVTARLGGRPADAGSVDAHEDATLAVLGMSDAAAPAHDDPDPVRRVARRILRRLDGMGKWGGYHTEFVHLSRGFRGNERALAAEVGKALVAAGLLVEKRSVGQFHVFLNPRRVGDIRRLIETGEMPGGLQLPAG